MNDLSKGRGREGDQRTKGAVISMMPGEWRGQRLISQPYLSFSIDQIQLLNGTEQVRPPMTYSYSRLERIFTNGSLPSSLEDLALDFTSVLATQLAEATAGSGSSGTSSGTNLEVRRFNVTRYGRTQISVGSSRSGLSFILNALLYFLFYIYNHLQQAA
jgi:hypothetical protein